MTKNIAILIGVSEYNNPDFLQLPVCLNDVDAMESLIRETRRFEEIIPLKDVNAEVILDELKKLSESDDGFGEIFIYFSGHGDIIAEEYFWVGKNYSKSSRHTTGLSRNTIFEVLRNIKNEHAVIVQDACFSGQDIVKGENFLSQKELGNILIISSSLSQETTPSGSQLSPFTDMFIEAASHTKLKGKVDYLDVMNKLKDLFSGNNRHKPHFAGQSPMSVTFCEDAKYLHAIRQKYVIDEAPVVDDAQEQYAMSNKEVLTTSDDLIITEKQAQAAITQCERMFSTLFEKQTDLKEYFRARTVLHSDFYNVDDEEKIVRQIKAEKRWDDFVKATITRTRVRKAGYWNVTIFENLYGTAEYETNFYLELNARLDGAHQLLFLEPTYKILRRHLLELVFIPGLFSCAIYWRLGEQGAANWDSFSEVVGHNNWDGKDVRWDDLVATVEHKLLPKLFGQTRLSLQSTISNLKVRLADYSGG